MIPTATDAATTAAGSVVPGHPGALLTPAEVDPDSGYRRYRRDQVREARIIQSLRWAAGFDGPEDDPTVLVEASSDRPRLWFQLVPEEKHTKNRVHLDLLVGSVHPGEGNGARPPPPRPDASTRSARTRFP